MAKKRKTKINKWLKKTFNKWKRTWKKNWKKTWNNIWKTIRGKKKRRSKKRAEEQRIYYLKIFVSVSAVLLFIFFLHSVLNRDSNSIRRPKIHKDYLTVNPYSRSGISLKKVNGIVVHYVANPGSSARENRDYFEGLKDTHETKASSHYIVGLKGEIYQCIPEDEIAYASNSRNKDTISIECCHPDSDGKFSEKTYESLLQLTAWLCDRYSLDEKDVIRHYDVTGKLCPVYYVKHEDAWEDFRKDVKARLQ